MLRGAVSSGAQQASSVAIFFTATSCIFDSCRYIDGCPYDTNPEADPVSRVQLALNVPDIDDAVAFYSKLFATKPAKRKPGYANFAIADPPLKLVLFEKAAPTAA